MNILMKYSTLLLLVVGLAACKSAKEAETTKTEDISANKLLDHLVRHQVQADWLEAKAKISYDGTDQSGSATASIIIRKDSLIWLSVRKLGFEIVRAQIDKDSVYLINRLTNEYTIKDLEYLSESYNLPASLKTIQAIFLGNPVFLNTRELKLSQEEQQYHLVSTSGQLENHFWLNTADLALARVQYGDLRSRREVDLLLEDYRPIDAEQKFSYLRQIKVDSSELGEAAIQIDFSDVKINSPQEVRFSIPPRYTRVD